MFQKCRSPQTHVFDCIDAECFEANFDAFVLFHMLNLTWCYPVYVQCSSVVSLSRGALVFMTARSGYTWFLFLWSRRHGQKNQAFLPPALMGSTHFHFQFSQTSSVCRHLQLCVFAISACAWHFIEKQETRSNTRQRNSPVLTQQPPTTHTHTLFTSGSVNPPSHVRLDSIRASANQSSAFFYLTIFKKLDCDPWKTVSRDSSSEMHLLDVNVHVWRRKEGSGSGGVETLQKCSQVIQLDPFGWGEMILIPNTFQWKCVFLRNKAGFFKILFLSLTKRNFYATLFGKINPLQSWWVKMKRNS